MKTIYLSPPVCFTEASAQENPFFGNCAAYSQSVLKPTDIDPANLSLILYVSNDQDIFLSDMDAIHKSLKDSPFLNSFVTGLCVKEGEEFIAAVRYIIAMGHDRENFLIFLQEKEQLTGCIANKHQSFKGGVSLEVQSAKEKLHIANSDISFKGQHWKKHLPCTFISLKKPSETSAATNS